MLHCINLKDTVGGIIMLVKLMNTHNDMILVNTNKITKVRPYNLTTEKGIVIRFGNEESEELIPDMTVEGFLAKCRQEDQAEMCNAILHKLDDLSNTISGACGNIARSIR